jgi:hypothetical protein
VVRAKLEWLTESDHEIIRYYVKDLTKLVFVNDCSDNISSGSSSCGDRCVYNLGAPIKKQPSMNLKIENYVQKWEFA